MTNNSTSQISVDKGDIRANAINAFQRMREEASASNQELKLDEINDEINNVRTKTTPE
jgi:hypothetical protein